MSLILLISADVRSKVHQGWWDGSVSRGVHHWSWWPKFNVLDPHGRRKVWMWATCSLTSTHVQCLSERENTHAYTLVQNKSEATTWYSEDSILLSPLLPQYNSSIVSALSRVWVLQLLLLIAKWAFWLTLMVALLYWHGHKYWAAIWCAQLVHLAKSAIASLLGPMTLLATGFWTGLRYQIEFPPWREPQIWSRSSWYPHFWLATVVPVQTSFLAGW